MKIAKADKGYEFIPLLIAKMFYARMLICLQSMYHSTKVTAEEINCCSRLGLPSESSEEMKVEEESSPMEH